MKRITSLLAALLLAAHAQADTPIASYDMTPVPGGDIKSRFVDGIEDPGSGCPSGWTCADKGTGSGSAEELSATSFKLNVEGTDDHGDQFFVYKSCGTADCQIKGRVTTPWQGYSETFTGFGFGITESTADDAWFLQWTWFANGTLRCKFGTPSGGVTSVNGDSSGGLPIYGAVTYHEASNEVRCLQSADGITWATFATATRALPNDTPIYAWGVSHLDGSSTQATLDNIAHSTSIDVYTPGSGGPQNPVCSGIPSQQWVVGVPVNFNVAPFCTDPQSQAMTFSQSGLPGAGGLTMSSGGVISGTPDADDLAASPIEVTVTATDTQSNQGQAQFQATVTSVPGDILTIPSGTSSVNCATFESGGPVDGGDILQIDGGVRGPLTITGCNGDDDNPIILRNDPTDASPGTIRRTSGTAPALQLLGVKNFAVDGSAGFSGDSGFCGYDEVTDTQSFGACGLIIETTGGAGGFVVRWATTSCIGTNANPNGLCRFRGVKLNGGNTSGVGLSMNDHGELASEHPGGWRENVEVLDSYFVDVGSSIGEAIYMGANQDALAPDVPLRNFTFRRLYFTGIARDCINTKSMLDGYAIYEYNKGDGCGESGESTQNRGLNLNGTADYTIRGNRMVDMGGEGLLMTWQDLAGLSPNTSNTALIENNVFANVGNNTGAKGSGAKITRNADSTTVTWTFRYNTIAGANGDEGHGVDCPGSSGATQYNVTDNILVGLSGSTVVGCQASNNRTGTILSQAFVNSGAHNYHLTAGSPACNSGVGTQPTIDFEGTSRPLDGAPDQGADENAVCP
jgi:hypothetical protein